MVSTGIYELGADGSRSAQPNGEGPSIEIDEGVAMSATVPANTPELVRAGGAGANLRF